MPDDGMPEALAEIVGWLALAAFFALFFYAAATWVCGLFTN